MENERPPLYPEGEPSGEPIQFSHEQLNALGEFIADTIDFYDSTLVEAVEVRGMSEEQAAQARAELVAELSDQLVRAEAGQFRPDPHADEKRRITALELGMDNVARFDRLGQLAVASGRWTAEEFAAKRQRVVDESNRYVQRTLGDE